MIKKYFCWGIIVSATLLFPILELIPLDRLSPWVLIPILILLVLGVFGGLFLGHLLLIWQNLDIFKRWKGFIFSLLGFIALFNLWYALNNVIFLEEANYWIRNLSFIVNLWLSVSTVTIGIVIFIYFTFNDYGIRWMAIAILCAIWGFYFLVEQLGGEAIFVNIVAVKMPILGIAPCLLMWFILAGVTTFIGRFFWFGYKEVSEPNVIEKETIHE